MKAIWLISMSTVVMAFAAASPSEAASSCLSLDLSAPTPMCAGQDAVLTATVTNSCSNQAKVSAQVTLDNQPVPVRSGFTVGGDSTMSKSIDFPVANSVSAGAHTVTVSLTDPAGDSASATIDVSIETCAATHGRH